MERQHHDGQERPDAGADRAAGRAEADRQRHRHQAVADQLHAVGEERQPRVAVGVGERAEEERQRLEHRRRQKPHPVCAGELGHLLGRAEGSQHRMAQHRERRGKREPEGDRREEAEREVAVRAPDVQGAELGREVDARADRHHHPDEGDDLEDALHQVDGREARLPEDVAADDRVRQPHQELRRHSEGRGRQECPEFGGRKSHRSGLRAFRRCGRRRRRGRARCRSGS